MVTKDLALNNQFQHLSYNMKKSLSWQLERYQHILVQIKPISAW